MDHSLLRVMQRFVPCETLLICVFVVIFLLRLANNQTLPIRDSEVLSIRIPLYFFEREIWVSLRKQIYYINVVQSERIYLRVLSGD